MRAGASAGALAALAALTLGMPLSAARAASEPRVAPRQALVVLLSPHRIHSSASAQGTLEGSVAERRPITGEQTVLPVLARRRDRRGNRWLLVRLPGRVLAAVPPPRTGWISADGTAAASTGWHLLVDRSTREVLVYLDGRVVARFAAIVGKPSTPTPRGEYFVEENVRLAASAPGAPFALATSDRSNVLQEFDGGPGQIAFHGLDNVGGQLGSAESHGCVRLADASVSWLAARIGPGVPVTVV
jgi:lipoprotein-anchoring transpeptidase ErfK/SrfK